MIALGEKRDCVKRFFSGTGTTYDEVVHRCTFGIDRLWKRRIIEEVGQEIGRKSGSPRRLLDLACGTGILTFEIARRFPDCRITGVDVTEGYLSIAREKTKCSAFPNVRFLQGWAEDFSSEEPFDCILSSYLAKYADLQRLVQKGARMLRPGGLLLFHDFTYPRGWWRVSGWEVYFKLLQRIGPKWYPEWRDVFHGLPVLIRRTGWVPELVDAMRQSGFVGIKVEPLTLQGSALVTGRKET